MPEDSVVASLSEIQAILQTGDRPRIAAVPAGPGEGAPPVAPRTVGAPVPSAAEIRETREARWREEMAESQRPAPAPAVRRFGAMAWALTSLAMAGGVAAGVLLWPADAVEAPAPVQALVATPVVPMPGERPSAAAVPVAAPGGVPTSNTASVPTSTAAGEADAPEETPTPAAKIAKRRVSRAARNDRTALDAAFGARPTLGSGREVQRPKVKRKRTRTDSQLDSVLNGL